MHCQDRCYQGLTAGNLSLLEHFPASASSRLTDRPKRNSGGSDTIQVIVAELVQNRSEQSSTLSLNGACKHKSPCESP